ncbi:dephospho-CoA kinase [Gammaproteobacteria bacterium]|nr:dephospho-CoA kinase [Gammaproteobacteria bacterium]
MSTNCVLLTGGIGSGKSTLSAYFLDKYNIETIDTDAIAKILTRPDQALGLNTLRILKDYFPDLIDDELILNRAGLRQRIFRDMAAKSYLESVLHPLIYQESLKLVHASPSIYCVLAIPLLYPDSKYLKFDFMQAYPIVINVEALYNDQIERVAKRDNISHELAQKIIDAQPTAEIRSSIATYSIRAHADIASLHKQADEIHALILGKLKNKSTSIN